MLNVSIVTQMAAFASLRDDWCDLTARSQSATVFDNFDWLWTWWDSLGRRKIGARLMILTVRDENARLVGAAPLYTYPSPLFVARIVTFLGTGVSDYHDVIAEDGVAAAVCDAVYQFLSGASGWAVADFNQLREGGNLRLNPPTDDHGFSWTELKQEECPYLALPHQGSGEENWAELLAGYSKKMRGNVRYYDRALDRVYEVKRIVASTPAEVKDGLRALYILHQRRWNQRWLPGVFYSKAIRSFHLEAAAKLLLSGHLRLHVLELDGSIEAVLYCFNINRVTSYYQGGFEPALAKLSLGTVITGLAIKQAATEQSTVFDFLRGDEPYKWRWTQGTSSWNHRRILSRKNHPVYPAAVAFVRFQQQFETRLKDWMHHSSLKDKSTRPGES